MKRIEQQSYLGWLITVALLLAPLPAADAQATLAFERDRMKMILDDVAREIERNFYDETLRGIDWKQVKQRVQERIDRAGSVTDMITAIFAMVNQLGDSHTIFVPPGRVARLRFGFEAKAFGDAVRVYELDESGPAAAAGLRLGDQILGINDQEARRESFDMLMLYLRRLRPVTGMNILIARGHDPPQNIGVEAKIQQGQYLEDLTQIETIYKYIREAQSEKDAYYYGRYNGGIGYLQLPVFGGNAVFLYDLVKKVNDSKAMIIDLRGNPGGSVETLRGFIGHFEEQETHVADFVRRNKTEPFRARPRRPRLQGPIFILVDSQTSSAGEVFARHFQRSGRGTVIGDRTSGRVTAARLFSRTVGADVVVLYGISVAVGRVVFPGGEELEGKGVNPDRHCVPGEEDLREKRDPCGKLALQLAREALGLPASPP